MIVNCHTAQRIDKRWRDSTDLHKPELDALHKDLTGHDSQHRTPPYTALPKSDPPFARRELNHTSPRRTVTEHALTYSAPEQDTTNDTGTRTDKKKQTPLYAAPPRSAKRSRRAIRYLLARRERWAKQRDTETSVATTNTTLPNLDRQNL